MGQGLESGVKKNHFGTKPLTLLGVFFLVFLDFLSLDFSFIFEVTSDSELYALWCRKGAQKEVFGKVFRSDSEVSGESENEAPVWPPTPFWRFQGAKKAKKIGAISGRGPRELQSAVFLHFLRFWVPAGFQEGAHFGARERFFCGPRF